MSKHNTPYSLPRSSRKSEHGSSHTINTMFGMHRSPPNILFIPEIVGTGQRHGNGAFIDRMLSGKVT